MSSEKKECFNIVSWNIACSKYDEIHVPLFDRKHIIIETLRNVISDIDVLVLLEAGRKSKGMSFTVFAAEIEEMVGLTYMGICFPESDPNPLGKAYFINRKTVTLGSISSYSIYQGERNGNIIDYNALSLEIIPVNEKSNPILLRRRFIDFVHLPVDLKGRKMATKLLAKNSHYTSCYMGDWNTFPDWGGPEMLSEMKKHHWIALTPQDEKTFQCFDHDIVEIPIENIPLLHPDSKIVDNKPTPDGKLRVKCCGCLDQVFVPNLSPYLHDNVSVFPINPGSDHAPILARLYF